MATEEMFTSLPTVSTAQMTDIICAVQGYSSPSSLGLSVQETLQQVYNLFQSNVILSNSGNPNGAVAGTTYQLCWDTVNNILYVCTVSGTSTTAVWTKSIQLTAGTGITIFQSGNNITVSNSNPSGVTWNNIMGATQAMVSNHGYVVAYSGGPVTTTLPTTSSFGDVLYLLGDSAPSWTITQAASQQIIIGRSATTIGVSGSVTSTNQFDAIQLICIVPNLVWQVPVAPQGNLTIV